MTRGQYTLIFGINFIIILLVLLPFLQGPGHWNSYVNTIFNFIQLISYFTLWLIPVGIVWTIFQYKKKHKFIFPILLCTVPTLAFLLSNVAYNKVKEINRSLAINNAENLITAIEQYKAATKHYPVHLDSLKPLYINDIPTPRIMGIAAYEYQKLNDNFQLSFTQNVIMGFNYEVVVYSPHNDSIAQIPHTNVYETVHENWKYYIVD